MRDTKEQQEVDKRIRNLFVERYLVEYKTEADIDLSTKNLIASDLLEEFVEGTEAEDINDVIDAMVDGYVFASNILNLTQTEYDYTNSVENSSTGDIIVDYMRGKSLIETATRIKRRLFNQLEAYGNASEFVNIGVEYVAQRRQDPEQRERGRKVGEKWQKDRNQVLAEPVYIED